MPRVQWGSNWEGGKEGGGNYCGADQLEMRMQITHPCSAIEKRLQKVVLKSLEHSKTSLLKPKMGSSESSRSHVRNKRDFPGH